MDLGHLLVSGNLGESSAKGEDQDKKKRGPTPSRRGVLDLNFSVR